MNLNFILKEMTHLRYWMPLVIEGNKRGIKSIFYVGASNKYNCPRRHKQVVDAVSKEHDIEIKPLQEAEDSKGLLFCSEKSGIDTVEKAKGAKKISCTYQTDFIESQKFYKDKVDHILMPSRAIADFYNLHHEKNLYLGIPKYDIELDKNKILKKYSLPSAGKFLTFIAPKSRDQKNIRQSDLLGHLHESGYTILFKSRGKDPIYENFRDYLSQYGHYCFEDTSWYPHTTQELLEISDLAINFGSTTIEECIMQEVPLVNFDIKPAFRNGAVRPYRVTHEYLYNYNFCMQMKQNFSQAQTIASIDYLTKSDLSRHFKKAKEDYLFTHKDSCKKILDVLL